MEKDKTLTEDYVDAFDLEMDYEKEVESLEECADAFNREMETREKELDVIEKYIGALREMTPTELEEHKAKIFKDTEGNEALTQFFQKAFSLAEA